MDAIRQNVLRTADRLDAAVVKLRAAARPPELAKGNVVHARQLADTIAQEAEMLGEELRHAAGRAKETAVPLAVDMGEGILRVLRLEDPAVQRSYGRDGLTVTRRPGNRVVVTGKPDALQSLKRHCEARTGTQLADVPLWHTQSAASAIRQLELAGI